MKKNSVIALMIFAILLTGCNRTGNLSDTPGGNSEYVENIMPSEFENCENEMLDINTYSLLNEPSEYAQSSCYSARISKGDMGYYHVIDHKLRVLDTKSQTLVTVCDKPNCRHEDSTCVANEMTSTSRVTMNIMDHAYYKGYVYFIGQNKDTEYVYLHRISGDGSVREECMPLFKFDSKAASYRWPSFVISHDILYYIDYEEKQPRIRKCGLDSKEQSVVFATENPDGLVYRMKIYGDFLFFKPEPLMMMRAMYKRESMPTI